MQIAHLLGFLDSLEVSIKKRNSDEESLIIALEVGKDFDHPVNHSCSEDWSDLMSLKAVLNVELCLVSSKI